jgi:hypothetical protein
LPLLTSDHNCLLSASQVVGITVYIQCPAIVFIIINIFLICTYEHYSVKLVWTSWVPLRCDTE